MRDLPQEPQPPPDGRFDVSLGVGTDEYVVVAVDGDVDISSSPAFRRALEDARAVGAATVVVDLAAVGFMDSTGFGQLVWLASGPGAPAVIAANCRPIVRNALRLMGMDRVLTIHAYGDASSWRGVRDTTI